MIFPSEFFELNLLYAGKIGQIGQYLLGDAILGYTHLYLSFGLDRSFDPANPVWQAYLKGLNKTADACFWTYSFYLDRQSKIPPKAPPDPSFGCFSYALWGQFLDRKGQIRQELSARFREDLDTSHSIESAQASFPFQALRLECPVDEFYRFYHI